MSGSNPILVQHHRDGFLLVSLGEDVSRAQPAAVRRAGDQASEEIAKAKPSHCLVDTSALPTLSSSVVAAIVRIWKTLSQHEGQMVIVAPSAAAREVLRITGLSNVWTVSSTMEAGIHALGFSKEAKVVKRERRLLVMVSAFSLLNATAAVLIRMLPQLEGYRHPNNVLVASILGLTVLTSIVCLFREKGWRLWLSIFVFLASLTLSGVFIWHIHYRELPSLKRADSSSQSGDVSNSDPSEVSDPTSETREGQSAIHESPRIPPLFGKPRGSAGSSENTDTSQPSADSSSPDETTSVPDQPTSGLPLKPLRKSPQGGGPGSDNNDNGE